MTNSKSKGKRAELEVVGILKEHGYDARRGVQYSGGPDSPDVVGLPNVHIEVKHVEKLNIHEAMDQARKDSGDNEMPCVFHRKNRTDWLVTMDIDWFMYLYKMAYGEDVE